MARQRLGEASKGSDPSAERKALRRSLTVAELCDLYLEAAADRVKASTLPWTRAGSSGT